MNQADYLLSDECLQERAEEVAIASQAHASARVDVDNAEAALQRVKQREARLHAEVRAIEATGATAELAVVNSIFDDDPKASQRARAEYRIACDERILLARAVDHAILKRRAAERACLQMEWTSWPHLRTSSRQRLNYEKHTNCGCYSRPWKRKARSLLAAD